ncbi:MAG: ankyrin repeat domain-containing protein [Sphingomonas sp.]|uniref:ankyrin repeat domain-containing protein n=1 Tax=Sphingomonas sp. TaxID=28214 RepID=UPI001ACAC905|nr:ankyrin repeat domain-containing protein [Sphingomonas sp.]MBN8808796.1 ankyrin repeat domain-containing protein [Sphingomonas sp.]
MPLSFRPAALALTLLAASPAAAQITGSPSYQFLQAVRDDKPDEVEKILAKPGSRIIDTQDPTTGESALHIVVKNDDDRALRYLRYLLARQADPNLKDRNGDTPLLVAVNHGYTDLVDVLVKESGSTGGAKVNVNVAGDGGQTPLIKAVLLHNEDMVRTLLDAGADPDRRDYALGKSARTYAEQDTRHPGLAKLFAALPKKPQRGVSGPTLR